ncbi:MAG: TonB family protein [Pseudomonadota bacterium]|nr:TonB family protein [Pseudomonadota bacterium]
MEALAQWRHPVALFLTGVFCLAAFLALHAHRARIRPAETEVMRISLIAVPSPPEPVVIPQPPQPQPPKAPKQQRPQPQPMVAHARMPEPVAPAPPQPTPPAVPPSPPVPAVSQAVSLEADYIARTRAEVERVKRYPMSKDARLERPAGTVTVVFTLARSGALLDAAIEAEAGSILDRQALVTVRKAAFAPFPPGAWPNEAQHRFRVDIKFAPS